MAGGIARSAGTAFIDVALGDIRGFQSELIGRMNEAAGEAGRAMSQRMSEEMSKGAQGMARGLTDQMGQATRTVAQDMTNQMNRAYDEVARGHQNMARGFTEQMGQASRSASGDMANQFGRANDDIARGTQGVARGVTEQMGQASRSAAGEMASQFGRANEDIGRGLRTSVNSSARSASDDIGGLIRGYENAMTESQRQVAGAMGRLSGQTREEVTRNATGAQEEIRRGDENTRGSMLAGWGNTARGIGNHLADEGDRSFERMGRSFNQMGQGFAYTVGTWGLGFMVGQELYTGISGAFHAATDVVVGFNNTLENAGIEFNTLFGAGSSASIIKRLEDFAQRTPYTFKGLLDLTAQLKASGAAKNINEVVAELTALGDALSASGHGADQARLERVVFALSNIAAQGKITALQMRQLTIDTGINAWQILADNIHLTDAQLQQYHLTASSTGAASIALTTTQIKNAVALGILNKSTLDDITKSGRVIPELYKPTQDVLEKMSKAGLLTQGQMTAMTKAAQAGTQGVGEQGKVTVALLKQMSMDGTLMSDQVIPALTQGMERKFGGSMEKASHTWSGLVSNIHDALERMGAQAGKPIFDYLEKAGERVFQSLDKASKVKIEAPKGPDLGTGGKPLFGEHVSFAEPDLGVADAERNRRVLQAATSLAEQQRALRGQSLMPDLGVADAQRQVRAAQQLARDLGVADAERNRRVLQPVTSLAEQQRDQRSRSQLSAPLDGLAEQQRNQRAGAQLPGDLGVADQQRALAGQREAQKRQADDARRNADLGTKIGFVVRDAMIAAAPYVEKVMNFLKGAAEFAIALGRELHTSILTGLKLAADGLGLMGSVLHGLAGNATAMRVLADALQAFLAYRSILLAVAAWRAVTEAVAAARLALVGYYAVTKTALTVNLVQSLTKAWAGLRAILLSVRTATIALNAVMMENPAILIIVAIVALGVAFYLLYTKVKPFRDAINDIGRFFREVFAPAIEYVRQHWQGLLQIFLLINPFTLVIGIFVQLYTHVALFRDVVNTLVEFFRTVFVGAVDMVVAHWRGLLQIFLLTNPITLALGIFLTFHDQVMWVFSTLAGAADAFYRANVAVFNALEPLLRFVAGLYVTVMLAPILFVYTAIRVGWVDTWAFIQATWSIGFQTINAVVGTFWWMWNTALNPIFTATGRFWLDVWNGARAVYSAVIFPLANDVANLFWWVWNTALNVIFTATGNLWRGVWDGARGTYNAVIFPLANDTANLFWWMWNTALNVIFLTLERLWRDIWNSGRNVYNTVIFPLANDTANLFWWMWNTALNPILLTMDRLWRDVWIGTRGVYDTVVWPMLDTMDRAFHTVFDGIFRAAGGLRDGLRGVFSDIANVMISPVRWIVGHVWNDGIVRLFNDAAGAFGIGDRLHGFDIPSHFATGGVIPGDKAKGDWIPFYGSAGEGILSLKDMAALGGETGFEEFRALLHGNTDRGTEKGTGQGNSHFADGGVLPHYGIGGVLGKIAGGVLNQMPGLQGLLPGLAAAKDFYPGVIEAAARAMLAPVMSSVDHMFGGNNFWQHTLKAIPHKVEDMLFAWMHKKDEESSVGPNGQKALDFLHAQAGKPYVWGAAGPGGYDCSGITSAVYNILMGTNPYNHTFSTGDIGDRHFPGGPGGFTIGWSGVGGRGAGDDAGHMAGVLMGTKFESRGGRGVIVGDEAVDATHAFDHVAHVNFGLGGIGGAIAGMFAGMGHLSDVQVAQLMVAAGFPKSEIPTGVAVVIAESDENPLDTNHNSDGSNDLGLWQINDRYNAQDLALGDWRNPGINTAMAHQAWARRGWKDWSTYSYWHTTDQYLGRGRAAQAAIHDNGGYIQPGEIGINKTNSPEPVFNSQQWSQISKLAARDPDIHVKVYVGDREITDIVKTEVDKGHSDLANLLNTGRKI